jgi:hypothetical protein
VTDDDGDPQRWAGDRELIERFGLPQFLRCRQVWKDGCDTPLEPVDFACPNMHHINDPSEECPVEIIQAWAHIAWGPSRSIAASATQCPPELLVRMAQDHEKSVRRTVASNPNCPPEALRVLALDPQHQIAALAFEHPNADQTLVDLVCECCQNDSGRLADLVQHNLQVSAQHLVQLAQHRDPGVRRQVAMHRNCPPEVVRQLASDPDARVRTEALLAGGTRTKILYDLANSHTSNDRRRAAEHPDCPLDLLRKLAQDPVAWVRDGVASNHRCDQTLVVQLAGDDSPMVHRRALEHPNLPEEYRTLKRVL